MAPRSFEDGVNRRGRVPALLYMDCGVGMVTVSGMLAGVDFVVGEHRVLEDDKVLSSEPDGDGDRDRDSPSILKLREGILSCLSSGPVENCCGGQTRGWEVRFRYRNSARVTTRKAVTTISIVLFKTDTTFEMRTKPLLSA